MTHESLPEEYHECARAEREGVPGGLPTEDGVFVWRGQSFSAWAQAQVDSRGVCVGAEFLVRTLAGSTPHASIERAEQEGTVHELTSEMLRQATHCARNLAEYGVHITVSVNVDPAELTPAFVDEVRALIAADGITPRMLCIELLERRRVDPTQYDVLRSLAELGCRIALDDYGTGESTPRELGALRHAGVPIDEVKVDRSLVVRGQAPRVARGLLRHGVTVVVEGVESADEIRDLPEQCVVQGYLTGRPVPLAVFERSFSKVTTR